MTTRCRPGRRLLAESGHALEPCTLGGIITRGDECWGVTAGHALMGFGNGLPVWYFPEGERARLGAYSGPAVVETDMDLAKFQVPAEMTLSNPLGFGQAPELFPEADIHTLPGESVVFLGGQVGRISGTVTEVGAFSGNTQAIRVQLACASLIVGDSGGPLYLQGGTDLFWLGTLVSERKLQNVSGFTQGLFLHPGRALTKLGIA